jgi:putative pyruvate formate lyase activating enzyme
VGDLVVDENGFAIRGLLIRHLVLPGGLAGTREIMKFIANDISPNTYVNIMAQYRPCGRAAEIEGFSARLKPKDFEAAYRSAIEEGLTRLDLPKRVFIINDHR